MAGGGCATVVDGMGWDGLKRRGASSMGWTMMMAKGAIIPSIVFTSSLFLQPFLLHTHIVLL